MLLPSGDHVGRPDLARHIEFFDGQAARFDLRVGLRRNVLGIGDRLWRKQSLGDRWGSQRAHEDDNKKQRTKRDDAETQGRTSNMN